MADDGAAAGQDAAYERARAAVAVRGLYCITADAPDLGRTHEGIAALALAGGAGVVQFREKAAAGARRVEAARAVGELCRLLGALFIVNDDPDLARETDADGLHLGQSDLPRLAAWQQLMSRREEDGRRQRPLLGVSVADVPEALRAVELGADYLGVGPIFATPRKPDAGAPIGLHGLRAIRDAVDLPLAAIGGVCVANAAAVLAAGADALCVMSAISHAPDPRAAAQRLSDSCARAARQQPRGAGETIA